MRILIAAAGSYGDIAPYTGLAARLRAAGHVVALAADPSYDSLLRSADLCPIPLPADPRSAGGAAVGRASAGGSAAGRGGGDVSGSGNRALMRAAAGFVRTLGTSLARAVAEADPEMLLLSTTTAPLGRQLSEALGIPALGVALQPAHPTGDFPPPVSGARSLGRRGNHLAGRAAQRVVDRLYADAVRALRTELGLSHASATAIRRARAATVMPVLHGFSTALVPCPADWPAELKVVGNWWPFVPSGARLPDRLADFLASGPPPVLIGFGSMGAGHGERLGRTAVRALRRAGVRGVLQAGWAGLSADDEPPGDDMLTIGNVPHALLLPHLAAVVHHAGAGTTAAALRAGLPSVPVPVTADQPFWAARLVAAGAGTAPLSFAALAADRAEERLAAAVGRAVRDASLRARAEAAARHMETEDGAGAVLAAVEETPLVGGV
ncbi:glycosyltransferase [Streptomyces sp. NPDC004749]